MCPALDASAAGTYGGRSIGTSVTLRISTITASGPPLPVLANSLERLRDLRLAAPRDDMETAYEKMTALKEAVGWSRSD